MNRHHISHGFHSCLATLHCVIRFFSKSDVSSKALMLFHWWIDLWWSIWSQGFLKMNWSDINSSSGKPWGFGQNVRFAEESEHAAQHPGRQLVYVNRCQSPWRSHCFHMSTPKMPLCLLQKYHIPMCKSIHHSSISHKKDPNKC